MYIGRNIKQEDKFFCLVVSLLDNNKNTKKLYFNSYKEAYKHMQAIINKQTNTWFNPHVDPTI